MIYSFPFQLLHQPFQKLSWRAARPALLLLLVAGLAQPALAQKYRTAAGFRSGGSSYGITIQQLVLPSTTLEGLGMLAPRERSATVLAERHFGILGPSLNYYLGAGGHYGTNKDDGNFWGFDGIIGAEYKIAFVPVVLSIDFKPTVEFHSSDWNRFPTGFSVRYIILKQKNEGLFHGVFDKIKGKFKGPDSE
ncbi:hypothetical protein AUC43_00745 [Hymenobacter sedentarius]|uniref:Uncharacterized protein n=1 Tax=Hymenobacter sedentarius TaxID=1411621 RepID=A0A0U4AJK1_9BACT|nr:hypothetical protein [Hymenobacter sedentarius]ALW83760.1 hypothetical protein AUC43_00745 [Hymenobacter sedentarius]